MNSRQINGDRSQLRWEKEIWTESYMRHIPDGNERCDLIP